jgi:hypothetical protein
MNLFKITSDKYSGEIEALYSDGCLVKLDFSNATAVAEVKANFKRALPVLLEVFLQGNWCGAGVTVVEASYEVSLEDFKREYPYKRNTHLLQPIWDKLLMIDRIKAVQEAAKYRKYCDKNEKWYKPMIAAAWLKNREYLNDWGKM